MAILETLTSSGLGVAILLIVTLFVGGAGVGVTWIILQQRRYKQFLCEIWQQDGFGQFTIKHDDAGIFVDSQTKNKRLFLKKHNVGLEPDNVPYLITDKGRKKVYLLQTGLKNFRYIKPVITENMITFTVGEEDVNWAINSYERQKKLFAQSWLIQYMPFILLAFVSIIILIMFIQLFKQLPMIKDIVLEMKEVVQGLAQAKSGTTVI
uniref:Uncharacterized protein n=1 Tax=viral metagenome TaxID=1070528 RepID=A0A6M3IE79_9ZZZZ